uniref:Uncharacterized protein n=1 Tax=Populus alba TaxID=43335 RepID=A0A4U5PQZ9_POPAL|nr:hypothetical protein D5086_0000197620 [Populus alba]
MITGLRGEAAAGNGSARRGSVRFLWTAAVLVIGCGEIEEEKKMSGPFGGRGLCAIGWKNGESWRLRGGDGAVLWLKEERTGGSGCSGCGGCSGFCWLEKEKKMGPGLEE